MDRRHFVLAATVAVLFALMNIFYTGQLQSCLLYTSVDAHIGRGNYQQRP